MEAQKEMKDTNFQPCYFHVLIIGFWMAIMPRLSAKVCFSKSWNNGW